MANHFDGGFMPDADTELRISFCELSEEAVAMVIYAHPVNLSLHLVPAQLKAIRNAIDGRLAVKSAAAPDLIAALKIAEAFIADELETRQHSFLPGPGDSESTYLADAESALETVREAIRKAAA